jgi:hypothetical protein
MGKRKNIIICALARLRNSVANDLYRHKIQAKRSLSPDKSLQKAINGLERDLADVNDAIIWADTL